MLMYFDFLLKSILAKKPVHRSPFHKHKKKDK